MIIGIGSDLIDITRVAKVIERHGERFLDRVFTDAERDLREPGSNAAEYPFRTSIDFIVWHRT